MANYYSGKGARYDRAVTKKILNRSIAKNKALKKAIESEEELNRAKWEQLLSELSYLEATGERDKRAIELFIEWKQNRPKL